MVVLKTIRRLPYYGKNVIRALDMSPVSLYADFCYLLVTNMDNIQENPQSSVNADQLWEVAWTYIRTVVDTAREPFLVLDENLHVLSANKTFYAFFQVKREETEGVSVFDLGEKQWNIVKLKILLKDILPKNSFFEDFKVDYDFPRIGHKVLMLNARRIYRSGETRPIMLLAMEDITKQIDLEQKLKEYANNLSLEVAKRTSELEKRVKELERVNKVMIGREMKMIELKRQLEKYKKMKT